MIFRDFKAWRTKLAEEGYTQGSLASKERLFLLDAGVSSGHVGEMWREYLETSGYSGQLSKMLVDWQRDGFPTSGITAVVNPTADELFVGDALSTITNYATITNTSNYSSGAGTISSAVIQVDGVTQASGAFTVSDGEVVTVLVTDSAANTRVWVIEDEVRFAAGSPASISTQTWTVDDTNTTINGAASGTGLTFTYSLTAPATGVTINPSTGLITVAPTAVGSGSTSVIAIDQYGRTVSTSFLWSAALRAQATAGAALDLSFPEGTPVVNEDLTVNWTENGNSVTYTIVQPLPTNLSVNSAGLLTRTGAIVATADANYTLRGTDEYGRVTDGTVALEVIVDSSPQFSNVSFNDTTDTLSFELSESATLFWATHTDANTLTPDGAGTGWTGTLIEEGTQAVAGQGPIDYTAPYTAASNPANRLSVYARDIDGFDSAVETVVFTSNYISTVIADFNFDEVAEDKTAAIYTINGASIWDTLDDVAFLAAANAPTFLPNFGTTGCAGMGHNAVGNYDRTVGITILLGAQASAGNSVTITIADRWRKFGTNTNVDATIRWSNAADANLGEITAPVTDLGLTDGEVIHDAQYTDTVPVGADRIVVRYAPQGLSAWDRGNVRLHRLKVEVV